MVSRGGVEDRVEETGGSSEVARRGGNEISAAKFPTRFLSRDRAGEHGKIFGGIGEIHERGIDREAKRAGQVERAILFSTWFGSRARQGHRPGGKTFSTRFGIGAGFRGGAELSRLYVGRARREFG